MLPVATETFDDKEGFVPTNNFLTTDLKARGYTDKGLRFLLCGTGRVVVMLPAPAHGSATASFTTTPSMVIIRAVVTAGTYISYGFVVAAQYTTPFASVSAP